jgi:adenylate cyclase
MTIRKKIFLLAGILLALFGVVVGALATIHMRDSDQIGNIVRYELPLSRLIASSTSTPIGTSWAFCACCDSIP